MKRGPAGFTLLELVVVVAILAVVSTIAVRMTTDIAEEGRWNASSQQIEDIRLAVLGRANEFGSDGTRITSGFIADMGRMPKTVIEPIPEYAGENAHTLSELYTKPATAASYGLYQATSAHLLPYVFGGALVLLMLPVMPLIRRYSPGPNGPQVPLGVPPASG